MLLAAVAWHPLYHWKCMVCGVGYWGRHPPAKFDTMSPPHWHEWLLIEVKKIPIDPDTAG